MNAPVVAKTITYPEARYLKHIGENYDVKVSFHIINNTPIIHIRDNEYRTFGSAIVALQHIQETEMTRDTFDMEAAS